MTLTFQYFDTVIEGSSAVELSLERTMSSKTRNQSSVEMFSIDRLMGASSMANDCATRTD